MSTNITTKFFSGATNGVIVTTSDFTRVVALSDSSGDKIKFEVPASSMSDIYIGEMGVRFNGTVSCSSPGTGGITLFLG